MHLDRSASLCPTQDRLFRNQTPLATVIFHFLLAGATLFGAIAQESRVSSKVA